MFSFIGSRSYNQWSLKMKSPILLSLIFLVTRPYCIPAKKIRSNGDTPDDRGNIRCNLNSNKVILYPLLSFIYILMTDNRYHFH